MPAAACLGFDGASVAFGATTPGAGYTFSAALPGEAITTAIALFSFLEMKVEEAKLYHFETDQRKIFRSPRSRAAGA